MDLDFTNANEPETYVARLSIGYDCISERYVVYWLDSFGGTYWETLGYGSNKKPSSMKFRFKYPGAPFVNEFIYDPQNDGWQLDMTVKNTRGHG